MIDEEKITQWFINNINGTPSEEQLALRKVYEQKQEIERLNNKVEELMTLYTTERNIKEDYKSIIKEAREYIEKNTQWYDKELGLVEMEGYNSNRIPVVYLYGLLEILDKVGEE